MPETAPAVLPPLPTYDCPLVPRAPVLDGTLGDPLWQLAPAMTLAKCVSGAPAAQLTTVRLLWHGDYLYLGAEMAEFDLEDHNEKHNDHVFGEQCVELFLAAPAGVPADDAAGPWRYLEYDTSPKGVFWDARVANPLGWPDAAGQRRLSLDESYWPDDLLAFTTWDGTLNDPRDRDTGWKLELQVPLTGPPGGARPEIGEVWRANIYRIHNFQEPDCELQSWSLVGIPNFHVPARFGYLRFAGPVG